MPDDDMPDDDMMVVGNHMTFLNDPKGDLVMQTQWQRRDRQPAWFLDPVPHTFAEAVVSEEMSWPRISVVLCSYNGAKTIRDTLKGLLRLDYPAYEVMVIDDGSTDGTAAITREYGFHLISTERRGLSSARNTGMQLAKGEIVAYIDDDAYPDRHWLTYLASVFQHTDHVGVGGPNLAPTTDGPIDDYVANAPGGPAHVLITDRKAEYIPGCNMAFRKATLQSIGGFDPRFRTAGDDVDACWRLQQRGWTLGFHPSALVWHHRRNSVRAYWQQQKGYGRAEAMLEQKWPQKYNEFGHLSWRGHLYGQGLAQALTWGRGHLYQGTWGGVCLQSLYQPAPTWFHSLHLMPEWYLIIASLSLISALSIFWSPLLLAFPVLAATAAVPILQAFHSARLASCISHPSTAPTRLRRYGLTVLLHLIQPIARLSGRLNHGLTPWRWRHIHKRVWPKAYHLSSWSEHWHSALEWREALAAKLKADGTLVHHGGDVSRWQLEVRGGMMGRARTRLTIEEHGADTPVARFRIWPVVSAQGLVFTLLFAILAGLASLDHAWIAAIALGTIAFTLLSRLWLECSRAISSLLESIEQLNVGKTA
jgi:GT2 family glycosyltransferase